MSLLYALKIFPSPLAMQVRWRVRPHPIKKRRRGWSVVRVTEPGCYQMGDTLFMHPDLIERMKTAHGIGGDA